MGKSDFYEKVGFINSELTEEPPSFSPEEKNFEMADDLHEVDPCPMCGSDVGWFGLSVRKSPMAFMLEHGYYRRCPQCRKEKQVAK